METLSYFSAPHATAGGLLQAIPKGENPACQKARRFDQGALAGRQTRDGAGAHLFGLSL